MPVSVKETITSGWAYSTTCVENSTPVNEDSSSLPNWLSPARPMNSPSGVWRTASGLTRNRELPPPMTSKNWMAREEVGTTWAVVDGTKLKTMPKVANRMAMKESRERANDRVFGCAFMGSSQDWRRLGATL